MFRDDFFYEVCWRSSLSHFCEYGFSPIYDDALRLMQCCVSEHPFDDSFIVVHRWSYDLECYVGEIVCRN